MRFPEGPPPPSSPVAMLREDSRPPPRSLRQGPRVRPAGAPSALEAMFFQPAVEGAVATGRWPSRGLAHVAAIAGEGLLDEHPLDRFERQVLQGRRDGAPGREPTLQTQIGAPAPCSPARHQHTALHRVVDLAHVARPGVGEEHLDGRARRSRGAACGSAGRAGRRKCSAIGRACTPAPARSGGMWISTVLSRRRSSPGEQNRFCHPSSRRSALVSETTRTSAVRVFDDPRRSNSPVSRTRRSLALLGERDVRDLCRGTGCRGRPAEAPDAVRSWRR